MEKKNIKNSPIALLFFLLVFFNCSKNKDFIEVTQGLTMNPSEPRYGIKLTSDNNLFFCKEKIVNGKRTAEYNYYKYKGTIDFETYKKQILHTYNNRIRPSYIKVNDAEYYQLCYNISSKKYKQTFIESDLNSLQEEVLFKLINFPDKNFKSFKEISHYNFSTELLNEKLPQPPALK